jgi:hypothetical protein
VEEQADGKKRGFFTPQLPEALRKLCPDCSWRARQRRGERQRSLGGRQAKEKLLRLPSPEALCVEIGEEEKEEEEEKKKRREEEVKRRRREEEKKRREETVFLVCQKQNKNLNTKPKANVFFPKSGFISMVSVLVLLMNAPIIVESSLDRSK